MNQKKMKRIQSKFLMEKIKYFSFKLKIKNLKNKSVLLAMNQKINIKLLRNKKIKNFKFKNMKNQLYSLKLKVNLKGVLQMMNKFLNYLRKLDL